MSSTTHRAGTAGERMATTEKERSALETAQDMGQRARASLEQGKRSVDQTIAERPASSVLLGFVIGAGVGTLIGSVLFERRPARRGYLSDGLMQRIADTVSRTVSDSIPHALRRD